MGSQQFAFVIPEVANVILKHSLQTEMRPQVTGTLSQVLILYTVYKIST